jgi:hypothetical protein
MGLWLLLSHTMECDYRRGLDRMLDLLTTYKVGSELHLVADLRPMRLTTGHTYRPQTSNK